jgi:hypothetical protein
MRRPICAIAIALTIPTATFGQSQADALAQARALDACAGRPVLAAEYTDDGRINVTCGRAGQTASGGEGIGPAAAGGLLLGVLLVLGGLGGGGSSPAIR